jgi:Domain of unknown function (DUF4249)
MQNRNIYIWLSLIILFAQSCIKEVNPITRQAAPILVVEGSITTDSIPYSVQLTYSGGIASSSSIPESNYVKDASVSISDNLGNTTVLKYTINGIYQTTDPSYIGKVGRSYSIKLKLKNGTTYISTPEKINNPVPISKVNATFVDKSDMYFPTYLSISIDAKDPGNEENYYQWKFNAWIGRKTKGVSCGFGCIMFEYCYQKYIDNTVRLLSDASINGHEIINKTVGKTYIYYYTNPHIDISQLSLTREAYQFLNRYQDQLTRTGSVLDPLPASIKGNVYNQANASDFALGYFSASAVTHKKVTLVPYSITPFLLETTAYQFMPTKSIACFLYYPDTMKYPPPPADQNPTPPGWENAEKIKVNW